MKVQMIAHTQLSEQFVNELFKNDVDVFNYNNSQCVALTAIRTCYSPNPSSDILLLEGEKYFNNDASDGKEGKESDRLLRHIINSGHTSTLEHINYTFAIEGVSRSLLAQLTRHRQFSFSVQSQRYVKFGSNDKSGGFDYILPPSIEGKERKLQPLGSEKASDIYIDIMNKLQNAYDLLREAGVPAEDARMVLPNGATCNIVMTANLRAVLEFYSKRKKGNGAQWEIADLAENIKTEVIKVDDWVKSFFE